MKFIKKFLCFLVFIAVKCSTIGHAAAQGVPRFEHFTQAQGLSSNSIEHIFRDSGGFLWVSTTNGLNRFDGYEFKQFHHAQSDSLTLPTGRVKAVSEDSLGRIWVACWGGVARIDPTTWTVSRLKLDVGDPGMKARHVHCDRKGRVWLSMEVGLFVFDLNGNRVGAWPRGALPDDVTVAVFEDSKGRIWAENKAGPCLYDEAKGTFIHFPENNPPYMKGNGWVGSTIGLEENADGTFFHGSWANGLKRFDPKTGKTATWLHRPDFAGHGAYNVITSVKWFQGKLWVASHDRGLGTFDTLTKKFNYLRDLDLDQLDLPTGLTNNLCATGNILWVASDNGLYKLDVRQQFFSVNKLAGLRKGSCMEAINRVIANPESKQSYVVSTNTCGLFNFDQPNNAAYQICGPVLCPNGLTDSYEIYSIFRDSRGLLWIATNKGLIRDEQGKQTLIQPEATVSGLLAANFFVDVAEDPSATIWAATLNGIVRLTNGGQKVDQYKLSDLAANLIGKLTDRIVDITLAPNGDVWFVRDDWREGYRMGLTAFRAGSGVFESYVSGEGAMAGYPFFRTSGTQVEFDRMGRMYCATQRGLAILNGATLAVEHVFTTSSGLNSDLCEHICKDSFGRVWVASGTGISLIDPNDLSIKNFSVKDGLAPFNISSLSAMANGQIAVGHVNEWLSVFKPDSSRWILEPDRLTLTQLESSSGLLNLSSNIQLQHDFGFLRIVFSPLNFLPTEKNQFKIILKGANGKTEYITSINEITLSGLAPGQYQLGIKPVHSFLALGQELAWLNIEIVPAFYQTPWFKLLILMVLLVAAATAILWRFNLLRKQQERELQLNWKIASTEMTALRSQMTPHFMFNALNTVNRFIWAEQKEQASDHLVKFARLTRKVLESSREQWVSLNDDLDTLRDYLEIEKVNIEQGLDYVINTDHNIDPDNVMVPPMMLQPFVENALKHGLKNLEHRGLIRIEVAIEGDELKCTIEDNGVGRTSTLAQVRKEHNSLGTKITAERIEVINALKKTNARFSYIDKTDGKGLPLGTMVVLYLPLIIEM